MRNVSALLRRDTSVSEGIGCVMSTSSECIVAGNGMKCVCLMREMKVYRWRYR